MTDNLSLWNKVEKTDPSHTKAITGKAYQGTSPKPHYLVHKATETFGPIGIGWGFSIVDERIEEGAGGEKMHFARVRVWYKWDGERGEVEHVGGTQFSGTRRNGNHFTDEDAPKKSVTDALVKALSMIGFAGDIFMGRYDDSKYVNEVSSEIARDNAAKSDAKDKKNLSGHIESIRTAGTLDALQETFAASWKECTAKDARDKLKAEYEARKAVLTPRPTDPKSHLDRIPYEDTAA